MRLYEHEAKRLFEAMGLTVPKRFGIIRNPKELSGLELTYPAMVKAMVLTGGRGKAGGVKKVADATAAAEAAKSILGLDIKGYPVETLLLEQAASEAGACYIGITTDPASYDLVVMASAKGGVDIEQVALQEPDAIIKRPVPGNERELPKAVADEMAAFVAAGLGNKALTAKLADALSKLFASFQKFDCKVAEINPLLITKQGDVIAADAKMVVDDNALYRQGELFELLGIREARHDVSELTPDEQRARAGGFAYVDLLPADTKPDPDKLYVGIVPGGAGYGIFSIDEVANIGDRFFDGKVVPVNFMDSGGGPKLDGVAEMFHLLMDKEIVDLVITSRFGGISSCDVFIRGLIKCLRDRHADGRRVLAVHGRMVGTDLPSAREYLDKAKSETPEALQHLDITVGNQQIMADVIKDGVAKGFAIKRGAGA